MSVADILRDHVRDLFLDHEQARAAAHILNCRTGRLGGHAAVCDRCGCQRYAYHSCRDRHCPRCGGLDQALWAEAQIAHLLPVSYFHVVFTIPACLRPFFHRHPDTARRGLALNALFAAVSEALLETAATRGIQIGILAVLHTWTQRMENHPHLHCLVPGGGLGPHGWNIDIRRPFAGPEQVVRYFARYTRRIAISDRRLTAYDGQKVTFRARNPKTRKGTVPVEITGHTFTKRFLNHVLPFRFVRIRRYGILSNR